MQPPADNVSIYITLSKTAGIGHGSMECRTAGMGHGSTECYSAGMGHDSMECKIAGLRHGSMECRTAGLRHGSMECKHASSPEQLLFQSCPARSGPLRLTPVPALPVGGCRELP